MQEPVRLFLMYVVLPLWLAAGFGDWLCHRRSRIEDNAGTLESVLHSLMLAQVGLPVLLVLFLEVNAVVFAVMLVAVAIHALTAWVDVQYASTRRTITPTEQHMHSLLEVLPLTAVSVLALAHWDTFLSVFGAGTESPRLALEVRREPLPLSYLVGLFVALGLFAVLPYGEELLRCLRVARARNGRASGAWRRKPAGDNVPGP